MQIPLARALAACFVVTVALVAYAAAPSKLPDYAGTWTAKFNDQVFLTLKLEYRDQKLSGSVSHGSITADQEGNLTGAEAVEGEDQVTDAHIVGDHLEFTGTDAEGQEKNHWRLKLTGSDQAELSLASGGEDAAKLKPFQLERASAAKPPAKPAP